MQFTFYGGSLDSHVVAAVAQQCRDFDLATMRFNWCGVGGSDGSPTGEEAVANADYAAAAAHLEAAGHPVAFACGYSFGAATAVRAAAIVNDFESRTSNRPFHRGKPSFEVAKEMITEHASWYDQNYLSTFVRLLGS